jgi:V8-like Glu-specific endopeptidase
VASLNIKPFLQICDILALSAGQPINKGTGWLCAPGVIATAGHVLYGADSCKVRWSSSPQVHQTANIAIHPAFDPSRIASDVDLAKIGGVPGPEEPLTPLLEAAAFVMAAGFQEGVLVEHSDAAKMVSPYLGHRAHTAGGHSGCPLLVGDKVVAVHIGTAAATRQFLSPAKAAQLNTLNSGILIGAPSTQFLYS